MNRLLSIGLVVVLACTAHAGGNPEVRVYIDFDPPNYVHELFPTPFTSVSAYVVLDQLNMGAMCISFRLNEMWTEYPGLCAPATWTTLWPGAFPIWGSPWEEPGITVGSTMCMVNGSEPIVVGRVEFFYLGGSGCIEILDHLEYPRWVADCAEPMAAFDYYCVYSNGSIGAAECAQGDCSEIAVHSSGWGSIKSLYR